MGKDYRELLKTVGEEKFKSRFQELLKQINEYLESILYYFKYRQINPQTIELLIETFKIGRLFAVNEKERS